MMKTQLFFKDYQQGLENGELLGAWCETCGAFSFHASVACNHCSSTQLSPKAFQPLGVIKTFTVIRVAAEGQQAPLIVALVQTDAGHHVLGNLEGLDPDAASINLIGRRVRISSKQIQPDRFAPQVLRSLAFTLQD
jgi:uncharacterized OB-fold protein